MKIMRNLKNAAGLTALIALAMSVLVGCSRFDAPTASQPTTESEMGLWAPNPGDEIIPGHAVPILNEQGASVDGAMIPPRTMRIGPQGGMIRLGLHSLIVPAGAVNDYVMITLAPASAKAIAVDCSPSPFQFNVPVTLVLSYANTQYADAVSAPPLSIIYMADEDTFEPLPSVVDPVNNTVSAQTDHFSRYIIG